MVPDQKEIFQTIACPVCGGKHYERSFSIDHNGSNVLKLLGKETAAKDALVVHCDDCGHKYMTPVINPILMDKYYSILNSEFYHNLGNDFIHDNSKEYKNYIQIISGLKPSGKVLEIGCGKGILLKMLKDAGYATYGIEPSPLAFKYATETLGLKVDNSFLANSVFRNEKFDVVVMIDVVEHIINIQEFFEDLEAVLNEEALVFIGTGNIDSFNARMAGRNWGYFLTWEHVSFFNKASMHNLLKKNNFKDIVIRETSLQHKPLLNIFEFCKNIIKSMFNPFLRKKYYHGITYDHFIVTAKKKKSDIK